MISSRPLRRINLKPASWRLIALCIGAASAAIGSADAAEPTAASSDPRPAIMDMSGLDGPYAMTREASGTSWQPDSTPMDGIHQVREPWTTMWHGLANFVYDDQGGPRGGTKAFSDNMLMFMGRRALTDGDVGIRLMISADPLMGKSGYPELFQTGETADGAHPLIDRQHPHNLLMEAAGIYRWDLDERSAVYGYAGLAGEPALGPPAFMHRFSGIDNPEAPLSHHWLDSTHVSYGVLTGGYVWDRIKFEVSAFNGREPDQNRYAIELSSLDSYAARLSYNPSPDLALQISTGRLASPEQLEPDVSVHRSTASASYNRMSSAAEWQTTVAWGRNDPRPGVAGTAWLLESACVFAGRHTLFGRAERVAKDDLFMPGQALYGRSFTINSVSIGYIYDFSHLGPARLGVGGSASAYRYPTALDTAYGAAPLSYLVFVRVRL